LGKCRGLKNRKLLLIGVAVLIWLLWTSKNNLVFNNSPIKIYMQILFEGCNDSVDGYKMRRGGKNVEACMWSVGDVDNVDFD
jgi:hypothetical protein